MSLNLAKQGGVVQKLGFYLFVIHHTVSLEVRVGGGLSLLAMPQPNMHTEHGAISRNKLFQGDVTWHFIKHHLSIQSQLKAS